MNETGTEQKQSLTGEAWPQSFKDLAGAWKDLPIAKERKKRPDKSKGRPTCRLKMTRGSF